MQPGRDGDHSPDLVPSSMSSTYMSYPPWRLHGGRGYSICKHPVVDFLK
jgi:hypothetical protein